MKKIEIDVGFGKLVAERYEGDGVTPELCVYLLTEDDIQDIVLVRSVVGKEAVECLVWADCDNEDYTKKYLIEKYTGE